MSVCACVCVSVWIGLVSQTRCVPFRGGTVVGGVCMCYHGNSHLTACGQAPVYPITLAHGGKGVLPHGGYLTGVGGAMCG